MHTQLGTVRSPEKSAAEMMDGMQLVTASLYYMHPSTSLTCYSYFPPPHQTSFTVLCSFLPVSSTSCNSSPHPPTPSSSPLFFLLIVLQQASTPSSSLSLSHYLPRMHHLVPIFVITAKRLLYSRNVQVKLCFVFNGQALLPSS